MSREKIKDRKISKESILFHNELPNEIVNKIKLLIDNANSGNEKFNLVKDIYKEQIDNAISLINDGYKIDVFLDDENDLSSYMFVGYIFRENFSDAEDEIKKQKYEFNNLLEQLSYRSDDNKKYKTVDEVFAILKNVLVKKDVTYDNKNTSILPVIIINQYKKYNSMLQMNSNMLSYYFDNENNYASNDYSKKDENPYIVFIDNMKMMTERSINGGKSLWDFDNGNEFIDVLDFDIKNVSMSTFDLQICINYISFDIIYTIVNKTKQFQLYIPIYVKRNENKINDTETKTQSIKKEDNVQKLEKEVKEEDNNKNKYELKIHRYDYYDEEFDNEDKELNNHINVYNGFWYDKDESLRLDRDFCKTIFSVHSVDEINVGVLEIVFYIRFISPSKIVSSLNKLYEDSYIKNEILKVVDKYNSEKDLKIKLFDDLEYNHFLLIYNYYKGTSINPCFYKSLHPRVIFLIIMSIIPLFLFIFL